MTVLFLRVATPPTHNSVCKNTPLVCQGWGVELWTDVCHPLPPQLPASEIKQTFFSTNLVCLLAFEWRAAWPHTLPSSTILHNHVAHVCVCVLAAQSCLTLCDPTDCSLPGSTVHGVFQARILEWVASPFSRGSFQPRDQTQVSHIAGSFFTIWVTKKPKHVTRSTG